MKNSYNGKITAEIKEELFVLYTEYPFLSFKDLSNKLQKEYHISIKMGTLSTIMYREYKNLAKLKNENKLKYIEKTGNSFPYMKSKDLLTNELKEECFQLYTKEPFLSLNKILLLLKDKYNLDITYTRLINSLNDEYGDIVGIKCKNKGIKKISRPSIYTKLSDELKKECYDLYVSNPFPTYNKLCEMLREKYNIDLKGTDLSRILNKEYPNISKIKNENRYSELGVPFGRNEYSTPLLNKDMREKCYELYTTYPFYTYNELLIYIKENYNISIKMTTLSSLLMRHYPRMGKVRRTNIDKSRLTDKAYKGDSIGKRQDDVIKFMKAGKTSMEIADELGISKAYLGVIKNKLGIHKGGDNYIPVKEEYSDYINNKIKEMWLKGCSFTYITAELEKENSKIKYSKVKNVIESDKNCRRKCKMCGEKVDDLNVNFCSDKCKEEFSILKRKENYRNRTPEQKAKYEETRKNKLIAQNKLKKKSNLTKTLLKQIEAKKKREAKVKDKELLRNNIVKYKIEGFKNREIAKKLDKSEKVIEKHITYLKKSGLL